MKKWFALLLSVILLSACSDNGENNEETKSPNTDKEVSEKANKEENQKEEVSFNDAKAGDTVIDDWGTYSIEKISEPNSTLESGPITFKIQKVFLAKFIPNQENESFFEQDEYNLAVSLINSENMSDDIVTFSPFAAKVTTNTQGQYEAQMGLNSGDSEHIGPVKEEFITAYNLEEENLNDITELNFKFSPASIDSTSVGEDIITTVKFE